MQNPLFRININLHIICIPLFFDAFYFVNFIYPLAYFPSDPTYGVFELSFNYQIISKATAIAYTAYTCYMLGLSIFKPISVNEIKFDTSVLSSSFYNTLMIFFLILSISYIASVGADFYKGYDWYTDENNSSPFVSFINLFG